MKVEKTLLFLLWRLRGVDHLKERWFCFGLGLERLLQFITGMTNIRDVIPFPRTPGNAEF